MSEYEELVKNLRFCAAVATALDCDGCEWKGGKYSGLKDKDGAFLDCEEQIKLEAADAIEELATYSELYKELTGKGIKCIRELLNKFPTWIPVTERLPKEDEAVLTWGEQGVILFDWLHDDEWGCFGEVTHWMPLPEPPKEEHSPVYESIKRGLEQAINGETREEETDRGCPPDYNPGFCYGDEDCDACWEGWRKEQEGEG